MSQRCYRAEEIAEIAGLKAHDERRRHLDDCPRCRALLASFGEFVTPPAVPVGANLPDAERRLQVALEREILGPGLPDRPDPIAEPGGGSGFLGRLRALWESPAWKPALGLAGAAALIAVMVTVWMPSGTDDGPVVLRGQDPGALVVHPPERLGTNTIRMSWTPVEGADRYAVQILDPRGQVALSFEAGTDTFLVLTTSDLARIATTGRSVPWRLAAFHGLDPVTSSRAQTLRLP